MPGSSEAHNARGLALDAAGSLAEALRCHQRAAQLDPNSYVAFNDLGGAYQRLGCWNEAELCYRHALVLSPRSGPIRSNYAVTLHHRAEFRMAFAHASAAASDAPDDSEVLLNAGVMARSCGELHVARSLYERARKTDPNSVMARWNLALLDLLEGDYTRGLPGLELRWEEPDLNCARRSFTQPQWDGSPIEGQVLLLHTEQGLGDSIQFVRYAKVIREYAGFIILECETPLVRLFAGVAGIDQIVARGEPLPAFDTHAPLMSLPLLCRTTATSIPREVPYIRMQPARKVSEGPRLRIGIVWSGSPAQHNNIARSIPLTALLPVLSLQECEFMSLQQGEAVEELSKLPPEIGERIVDRGSSFSDLADTAEAIVQLDGVIAVDTSVAHLAGALGIPVWVLLSCVPDWRWMVNRSDSPWYPTARLFRQPRPGDWAAAVSLLKDQIVKVLAEGNRAIILPHMSERSPDSFEVSV